MNFLEYRDYDDVSFLKQHPTIKGVIITLVCIGIFMIGASFNKLITPNSEEEVKTVNVEIEQKGKLIVAETNAHDADIAKAQAKIGFVPLWYENTVEYDCYEKSTVTYDLDQTKITANTLTKTVSVPPRPLILFVTNVKFIIIQTHFTLFLINFLLVL